MKLNVTDEQIAYYIFGDDLRFDRKISSPLHSDNDPSFKLYSNDDGISWYDYSKGKGGPKSRMIHLLMHLIGVSDDRDGYFKAVEMANEYIPKNLPANFVETIKKSSKKSKTLPIVEFKEFTEFELQWWGKFGITLTLLNFWGVGSVRKVVWGTNVIYGKKTDLIFYWEQPDGSFKIYRPLRTHSTGKWYSNIVESGLIGLRTLDRSKTTLLVSSLKDQMSIDAVLGGKTGIVSPFSSESARGCWDRLVCVDKSKLVMMDADFAGWIATLKIADQINGIPIFLIPYFESLSFFAKDFAEVAETDVSELKRIILEIAHDVKHNTCRYVNSNSYEICKLIAGGFFAGKENVKIPKNICLSQEERLSLQHRKIIIQDDTIILKK